MEVCHCPPASSHRQSHLKADQKVVAGRFPLYTDEDVHGHLIKALRRKDWEVVRAVDVYPLGTDDEIHFEHAAKEGLVFVSNDQPALEIATEWLSRGKRSFRLITWPQERYTQVEISDLKKVIARAHPRR